MAEIQIIKDLREIGLNDNEIETVKKVVVSMDGFYKFVMEKDPNMKLKDYTTSLMIVTLAALGIDKDKVIKIFQLPPKSFQTK